MEGRSTLSMPKTSGGFGAASLNSQKPLSKISLETVLRGKAKSVGAEMRENI